MTYAEILPLSEVKTYLQLEQDYNEEDSSLERMARSALQFIEKRTNHVLQLRTDVNYTSNNNCITVFDYPIRYSGDDIVLYYSDKTVFHSNNVSVDLGYLTLADVPAAFIDAALIMIGGLYYKSETKETSNSDLFMNEVNRLINDFRRFTVI